MVEQHFKAKFKEWFDTVSGHDIQVYQDLEWDWEKEIEIFLKTPINELDTLINDAKEVFDFSDYDDHE